MNSCTYRGHEWKEREVVEEGVREFVCIHCDEYRIEKDDKRETED
jgi:hypothetical protein